MQHRNAQKLLAIAGGVQERRDLCKLLWAEEYSEKIQRYREIVRKMKDACGGELQAAMHVAKKVQEAKRGEDLTVFVAALFAAALDEIEGVAA